MKFTLEIELGNEGMRSIADVRGAILGFLGRTGFETREFELDEGTRILDINGNTVGKWEVVPTAGDQDCTGTKAPEQNNCDGSGPHTPGEVRLLPIGGGGNVILCRACFDSEIKDRRRRNRDGFDFELPTWKSLRVYGE